MVLEEWRCLISVSIRIVSLMFIYVLIVVGIYEGQWKDNQQNGFGILKYTNGDVYKGYFKDGLPHGHGSLKHGHFMASAASIYIGDWSLGNKNGYGVIDDIVTGEKYLGNWSENKKHGNGIIVTSDGIYYEGVFNQDVLTVISSCKYNTNTYIYIFQGHGLMILEDGTHYEGDFKGTGYLNGKGTLTLKSGHVIEGTLTGSLNEGLKVTNALLSFPKTTNVDANTMPKYFGTASTPVYLKWKALFKHCYQILGVPDNNSKSINKSSDNQKIWQNIAVIISNSHQGIQKKNKIDRGIENTLNHLDTIPQYCRESITPSEYTELKAYLQKVMFLLEYEVLFT